MAYSIGPAWWITAGGKESMNRLQLATLLSWADEGKIEGRKRLQKVVYFLQEAGCRLDCQYSLHHFGPYSRDVADTCDEMVAAGLVAEIGGPQNREMQYTYTLKPHTCELLKRLPKDPVVAPFQGLGATLIKEDLWTLELGSTILLFFRQSDNWDDALAKACAFKRVRAEETSSKAALALAQRVDEMRTAR